MGYDPLAGLQHLEADFRARRLLAAHRNVADPDEIRRDDQGDQDGHFRLAPAGLARTVLDGRRRSVSHGIPPGTQAQCPEARGVALLPDPSAVDQGDSLGGWREAGTAGQCEVRLRGASSATIWPHSLQEPLLPNL